MLNLELILFMKELWLIGGIAGIGLSIFLTIFKEIIRANIFSKLNPKQSYTVIMTMIVITGIVALLCLIQYFKDSPNQVTVLVHSDKGKDDLVLTNRGKVKLIYGDANVEETINSKGEATFKQIPAKYFRAGEHVEIHFIDPKNEPYRAINPDSIYNLTRGKYISLTVKLYGLSSLTGIVKDYKTGNPIEGAQIRIHGIGTISNQFGEYTLSIPIEEQRKFQTVRAFKDGYEPFEICNVPIQTETECPISMKPINK